MSSAAAVAAAAADAVAAAVPAADRRSSMSSSAGSTAKVASLRMGQFYKTKTCPWFFKGRCERGLACRFAHNEDEKRQLPDLSRTSFCPSMLKAGSCSNASCRFAHHAGQLRATQDMYKTSLCFLFMKSRCAVGAACRHAHGVHELRVPTGAAESDDPHQQPAEFPATTTPRGSNISGNEIGTLGPNTRGGGRNPRRAVARRKQQERHGHQHHHHNQHHNHGQADQLQAATRPIISQTPTTSPPSYQHQLRTVSASTATTLARFSNASVVSSTRPQTSKDPQNSSIPRHHHPQQQKPQYREGPHPKQQQQEVEGGFPRCKKQQRQKKLRQPKHEKDQEKSAINEKNVSPPPMSIPSEDAAPIVNAENRDTRWIIPKLPNDTERPASLLSGTSLLPSDLKTRVDVPAVIVQDSNGRCVTSSPSMIPTEFGSAAAAAKARLSSAASSVAANNFAPLCQSLRMMQEITENFDSARDSAMAAAAANDQTAVPFFRSPECYTGQLKPDILPAHPDDWWITSTIGQRRLSIMSNLSEHDSTLSGADFGLDPAGMADFGPDHLTALLDLPERIRRASDAGAVGGSRDNLLPPAEDILFGGLESLLNQARFTQDMSRVETGYGVTGSGAGFGLFPGDGGSGNNGIRRPSFIAMDAYAQREAADTSPETLTSLRDGNVGDLMQWLAAPNNDEDVACCIATGAFGREPNSQRLC